MWESLDFHVDSSLLVMIEYLLTATFVSFIRVLSNVFFIFLHHVQRNYVT